MDCDSHSNGNEECAHSPMIGHEDCAIEQGNPECGDRNDLYPAGNSLVFEKVGYVAAQFRVVHQPVIQLPVSA